MRWQFKDKAPLSVTIVLVLFFVAMGLDVAMVWIIPEWSPRIADRVHSFPITYKGGVTYFVKPSIAKMWHDLNWITGGLGAACFILFFWHRDKLERIS